MKKQAVDEKYMNTQRDAFFKFFKESFDISDLNKAIELANALGLSKQEDAGKFVGRVYRDTFGSQIYPIALQITPKILQEAFFQVIENTFKESEKEAIYDELAAENIRISDFGPFAEFELNGSGKDELEQRIMDRLEEDGDIAISDTAQKLFEKMRIDVNELRRRVREKLKDKKEEEKEEEEITEMAAVKKHRQRLKKIFK